MSFAISYLAGLLTIKLRAISQTLNTLKTGILWESLHGLADRNRLRLSTPSMNTAY